MNLSSAGDVNVCLFICRPVVWSVCDCRVWPLIGQVLERCGVRLRLRRDTLDNAPDLWLCVSSPRVRHFGWATRAGETCATRCQMSCNSLTRNVTSNIANCTVRLDRKLLREEAYLAVLVMVGLLGRQ